MEITYKDFVIKKDQYCFELTRKVKYEKLDKLGGVPTGEIGEKEVSLGYFGLARLDEVMLRILLESSQDDLELRKYIESFTTLKEELKNFVKNECITSNKTN